MVSYIQSVHCKKVSKAALDPWLEMTVCVVPQVPGHDQMFHRKKMHSQLFGINDHGVFSVSKETGEVCIQRKNPRILFLKYDFVIEFSAGYIHAQVL